MSSPTNLRVPKGTVRVHSTIILRVRKLQERGKWDRVEENRETQDPFDQNNAKNIFQ